MSTTSSFMDRIISDLFGFRIYQYKVGLDFFSRVIRLILRFVHNRLSRAMGNYLATKTHLTIFLEDRRWYKTWIFF